MPQVASGCLVAYPVNADDLMVLVNKGGICVFRTILADALRTDFLTFTGA